MSGREVSKTVECAVSYGAAMPLTLLSRSLPSRVAQLALLALGLALSTGACAQLPPPGIKPDSGPWDSGAGFYFDLDKKAAKNRQSISGIADNGDARQRRICLMAFDEWAEAR